MRAAVIGFGCRLNASETEAMLEALAQAGVTMTEAADADVVVVNGCTITHAADLDAAAAVRRIARTNPGAKVVVTGCYAESSPREAAALPGVVAVIGNASKPDIVDHVARAGAHTPGEPDVAIGRLRRGLPLRVLPPVAHARARALLKVQDGCDYRCSFCIVPSVRGPSRSLTADDIVGRARTLVEAEVAELVLTGVHLGTWGRDHGLGRGALAGLVARLIPELGGSRLRLSSVDPHEVDAAMLALFAGATNDAGHHALCRHLHLPVQSCDDEVLAGMRRGHRTHDFVSLVNTATANIPGIAISTDIIVGFPGESDAAFARTFDVLSSLPLAYLHVFPYSVRRGTAAAQMPAAVPAEVIRARAAELRALSLRQRATFRAAARGRVLDVVVHRRADRRGTWWARSDNDLALQVGDATAHAGRRVAARVAADGEHAEILA